MPDWAAAIDNFPSGNGPAHTCDAPGACQPSATSAPGATGPQAATFSHSNGAHHSASRALIQSSILPYLASAHTNKATSANMPSPGRHINHPIVIIDNSPDRNDRNHTRKDTRGGAIIFQAGSVRFALAPYLDPTLIAVIQYPAKETGIEVEWSEQNKRKLAEMAADEGDVFTDGRGVEENAVTSSSTAREAIPTCNGRKRRCIAVRSTPACSTSACSTSATPSVSTTSKGKGRAV